MISALARNSECSSILKKTLRLRTEPIAVKLVEPGAEVTLEALYPLRDFEKHIAICQAFAIVRRERKTIYCDKESEWCWAPLVAFGLCECVEGTEVYEVATSVSGKSSEASRKFINNFPRLPLGKYAGIFLTPLSECEHEPDVTLIYCDDNAQLRGAVLAVKRATGELIETQLDAIDSCAYSCVATINSDAYRVTIPDIGEHERAFAGDSEIILSVPGGKLGELCDSLTAINRSGMGYVNWKRELAYEFPRPMFYDEMFRLWGLL